MGELLLKCSKRKIINRWESYVYLSRFHSIGRYDVPANIDYVTGLTGAEKIFYIGLNNIFNR